MQANILNVTNIYKRIQNFSSLPVQFGLRPVMVIDEMDVGVG